MVPNNLIIRPTLFIVNCIDYRSVAFVVQTNIVNTNIVFLDLAKAFDKVPHFRLLEKLKKHGINGKLLRVIDDWLRNRRQSLYKR